MDAATLWVTLVGACAAVAAAVFTFVQARAATESRRDAQEARNEAREARDESVRLATEANAAFIRQAEAQEEANEIEREKSRPDDWSVGPAGGSMYRATNTSKRLIIVESITVQPERTKGLVHIETNHPDGRYEFGDSFEFAVLRVSGPGPEKMTIRYRYEDNGQGDWRSLHITL
ncbi:hypothetical protein LJR045_002930 [Microbacterium sp. LjRoot45]|uniref:hypothetical protein n=1 Tax=Microbacterium sp. LjRoot45 TaxID=3342329 RepID=UPI003ECD244B